MPQNSKTKRQKPSANVPEHLIKDGRTPQDNSGVVRVGGELNEYLDELQRDKMLNFDLPGDNPN